MERALLWLGPVAVLIGLASPHLWEQWSPTRLTDLLLLALPVWGLAWLLGRVRRSPQANWLLVLWAVVLLVLAGPLPTLMTAVLVLAAIALGGMLLPRGPAALQGVLGILLLAGIAGWLLTLPVHYNWSYLVLCVGLVLVRRRELIDTLRGARNEWKEAVTASPRLAAFCVLVIGLAAASCWLPTMQEDDLAYHLRLAWQLQQQAFYTPSPEHQVWALAPWTSDVVHAIAQLMSGSEARGPVNMFWLLALASGLWRLCAHLGAPVPARWLAAAVAISQPMTTALASGMQTELPTAAALVWLFAMVAGPRDGSFRFWLALAVLAGGLMSIKTTSAVMAFIPLLWALFRHPWPSLPRIGAVLLVGLLIAGSSYLHAFLLTGNPVLPLFNAWFKSPYFAPVNFLDDRWYTGFGPSLFWDMSFHTHLHDGANDGGGSFLLVALVGPWLLALLHRPTRIAALAATCVLVLPLIPLQYMRYAYPGLAVLSAVLVSAAFSVDARRAAWIAIGLCVLHLGFQANAYWTLRYGAIKQAVKAAGRDEPLYKRYAPERIFAKQIRKAGGPSGNVLLLDPGYGFFAEFGTQGRNVSWYSPSLLAAANEAEKDPTGQAWIALIQRENVHDVILRNNSVTPAQREALRAAGATQRGIIKESEWWTLPEAGRQ